MSGARVILGAALGLLVVAIAAAGARSSHHVLRSNLEPPAAFTTVVSGGDRLCQGHERVPAGAGAVRLRIGTYGPPGTSLQVSVWSHGRRVANGSLADGWRQGDVAVPISDVRGDHDGATLCLTNEGRKQLALAGTVRDPSTTATINGAPATSRVWIQYLEPRSRSDWALTSSVVRRVGDVRDALPGGLTVPVWCLLALFVGGGAVALVMRELRE
jgi:hypothetical protein